MLKIKIFILLAIVVGAGFYVWHGHRVSNTVSAKESSVATDLNGAKKTVETQTSKAKPSACANNSLSREIIVSVSARHLWACNGAQVGYDSAVITGMENIPADLTPVGTYHIYDKLTDQTLKGSDSTGSWNDFVHYWMPFLNNQYGTYGLHDATWRSASAFGNISPYSSNASHGCVELPLATAKWIYDWAPSGTAVTIEA